jgi:hypothetical protein
MLKINRIIYLLIFGLGLLLISSNPLAPKTISNPVFLDDFEQYKSEKSIKQAYKIWDEGAILEVSLENLRGNSGTQSLKINLISPNPVNQSINGSIYRVVPFSKRNWSGGSELRFWIENNNPDRLLLSFNIKERANEYWAIADKGIFFFQDQDGAFLQKEILYGNLPIPAHYQGFVVVPFIFFSVPDWNTARGNHIMNLSSIESYALAVNIEDKFPRSFLVDDIEILNSTISEKLTIQGSADISVPASGEHREQYSARTSSLSENIFKDVDVEWSLREPYDLRILLENGILTIPAGTPSGDLILVATYSAQDLTLSSEFTVHVDNIQLPATEQKVEEKITPYPTEDSTYNRFSSDFESWAVNNRPLFVILAITFVLLILFALSMFQRRLR